MAKRGGFQKLGVIGWRERVALPEFGLSDVKVKVDTGARTSALHATRIKLSDLEDGGREVAFTIVSELEPRRTVRARARLIEERTVRSSSGQATVRPVIEVKVRLGDVEWPVEVTLVNRDPMGFRMLLGRRALSNRFLVHPGRSFLKSSESRE